MLHNNVDSIFLKLLFCILYPVSCILYCVSCMHNLVLRFSVQNLVQTFCVHNLVYTNKHAQFSVQNSVCKMYRGQFSVHDLV